MVFDYFSEFSKVLPYNFDPVIANFCWKKKKDTSIITQNTMFPKREVNILL